MKSHRMSFMCKLSEGNGEEECRHTVNTEKLFFRCRQCRRWLHVQCYGVRVHSWDSNVFVCSNCHLKSKARCSSDILSSLDAYKAQERALNLKKKNEKKGKMSKKRKASRQETPPDRHKEKNLHDNNWIQSRIVSFLKEDTQRHTPIGMLPASDLQGHVSCEAPWCFKAARYARSDVDLIILQTLIFYFFTV